MNNCKSLHKSPCRFFKENGLLHFCTAVKPMLSVPDCNFGTESYCINGRYRPTNLYRNIETGQCVFALDIVGSDYVLLTEDY